MAAVHLRSITRRGVNFNTDLRPLASNFNRLVISLNTGHLTEITELRKYEITSSECTLYVYTRPSITMHYITASYYQSLAYILAGNSKRSPWLQDPSFHHHAHHNGVSWIVHTVWENSELAREDSQVLMFFSPALLQFLTQEHKTKKRTYMYKNTHQYAIANTVQF